MLCESPLAVNPAQTKGVVKVAISKKLFLMEAVATKFLAAHEKANRMIKNGKIGEVTTIKLQKCKKETIV